MQHPRFTSHTGRRNPTSAMQVYIQFPHVDTIFPKVQDLGPRPSARAPEHRIRRTHTARGRVGSENEEEALCRMQHAVVSHTGNKREGSKEESFVLGGF